MRRYRRHVQIVVALAAAALNVLAPVLAYAIGQPLHELQHGYPGGGARVVLASPLAHHHAATRMGPEEAAQAMHHAGGHAMHHAGLHTMQHNGAHAPQDAGALEEPAAPHCPYCLDFAAGVALGTTLPVVAFAQPAHVPLPASETARVRARPSLRLAPSRGPPALA